MTDNNVVVKTEKKQSKEQPFFLPLILIVVWAFICTYLQLASHMYLTGAGVIFIASYLYRYGYQFQSVSLMKKHDYPKQIAIATAATKRFPKDSLAFAHLANGYLGLNQYEEALQHANTATELAGDQRFAYMVRGIAHVGLHNYEEAVADCTKAIAIGQKHVGVYLMRSYARANLYRFDEALADIEQASKIAPKNSDVELFRAWPLLGMNRSAEAREISDRVFESVSADMLTFALFVRALVNNDFGNFDLAIEDMNTAKDVHSRHEEVHINLAYFHAEKGEFDKSQEYLDKLSDVESSFHKAYRDAHQARLLLIKGQNEEALTFSKCAVTLRPGDMFVHETHGVALLRNGLMDDAKAELDLAIQKDPYRKEAYWFRAEIHEKMGNLEEAEKDKKIATDRGYIPYL